MDYMKGLKPKIERVAVIIDVMLISLDRLDRFYLL